VNPVNGLVYVTCEAKGEVYVNAEHAFSPAHFAVGDTTRNVVVATIPVGQRVWGLALSPDGQKLYTANGASNDVSVIDVRARKELKRIKGGDGPWWITVRPNL
jgi:YVTN family beta-propeller protein